MDKENILKLLEECCLTDLEEIRSEVNKLIDNKKSIAKKVIYTNDCYEESNYHKRKYRHYAKELTGIDITKTNGYAFQGKFLKIDQEDLVTVGSYVVECCFTTLSLYLIKEDGKELIFRSERIISFIQKAKEITGL